MYNTIFTGQSLGAENSAEGNILKESTDSAGITQRVIKIEGKVDKPRTIFIIPRTKLVNREEGSRESYAMDPLFPDLGVADQKN